MGMQKQTGPRGVSFVIGVSLATLLWGCVSAIFPYKYYGIQMATWDGRLLGKTPADDLDLKMCMPTNGNLAPCSIIFNSDLQRLIVDYKDKENQIIYLQRNCNQ